MRPRASCSLSLSVSPGFCSPRGGTPFTPVGCVYGFPPAEGQMGACPAEPEAPVPSAARRCSAPSSLRAGSRTRSLQQRKRCRVTSTRYADLPEANPWPGVPTARKVFTQRSLDLTKHQPFTCGAGTGAGLPDRMPKGLTETCLQSHPTLTGAAAKPSLRHLSFLT